MSSFIINKNNIIMTLLTSYTIQVSGQINWNNVRMDDFFTKKWPHLSHLNDDHWPIRKTNVDFSWAANYKTVNDSGHRWCSVVRDNWACSGDIYENTRDVYQVPGGIHSKVSEIHEHFWPSERCFC